MHDTTNLLADETIWQRTFDAVPDLIFILDTQHRIVRTNRAAAERLGCRIDELTGRFCHEVMHGTDQAPEFCPHAQLLRDGHARTVAPVVADRPDTGGLTPAARQDFGHARTVEMCEPRLQGHFAVSVTPICGADGEIIGAVHVARDISEFKRMETELRQASDHVHQRYAQAVASTLDGLWEWDIASGRVEYSPRWETLLGLFP